KTYLDKIAKEVDLENRSTYIKAGLISALIAEKENQVRNVLQLTWWHRHQKHIYGLGGILVGVIGILVTIFFPSGNGQISQSTNDRLDAYLTEKSMTALLRIENNTQSEYKVTKLVLASGFPELSTAEPAKCRLPKNHFQKVAYSGGMQQGGGPFFDIIEQLDCEFHIKKLYKSSEHILELDSSFELAPNQVFQAGIAAPFEPGHIYHVRIYSTDEMVGCSTAVEFKDFAP
ncbi:MAG: hypothetical protein AAGA30_08700, partial [Planctomycetota bacterium]